MTTRRTSPLPPGWPKIRRRILDRDGWRCTWLTNGKRCTATSNLEVDHIGDPNDHRDEMLRTLCHDHHAQRTAIQANAARWAHGTTRRPAERHPGLR